MTAQTALQICWSRASFLNICLKKVVFLACISIKLAVDILIFISNCSLMTQMC